MARGSHRCGRRLSVTASIDRRAVVGRHSPVLSGADEAVLSVGNGSFAAGVDRTGTQTFTGPGHAESRINTLAEWGWHTLPTTPPVPWESLLRPYRTPHGEALFMDLPGGTEDPGPGAGWFRENPHKVSLLRFFLVDLRTGEPPRDGEITGARQQLDLWTGAISSRFRFRGSTCRVVTAADPEQSALALQLTTPGLGLALGFPYGSRAWHLAADWDRPEAHTTLLEGGTIHRRMDDLSYDVDVRGAVPEQLSAHRVALRAPAADPGADGVLEIALRLRPRQVPPLSLPDGPSGPSPTASSPSGPAEGAGTAALAGTADAGTAALGGTADAGTAAAIRERSARFWARYWQETAAIDLGAADDPQAEEIERRTVLSRYLQRVHAAGHLPPAETGLLTNSWRGKFHLEMHWWHAAHFALWGDAASLQHSLAFYTAALPVARETAARHGCRGARWPKQVGPDLRESPSDIGPFLIWQQPHPIHLAELARRAQADPLRPDPASAEIVEQTALFLVDSLRRDGNRLGVGPPVIGAQERHVADRARLRDPSFELAYIAWALRIADAWRHRRGAREAGQLTALADRIHSPLTPDGLLATFRDGPAMSRSDHPSQLLAYGMVPPATGTIPPQAASAALDDVLAGWDWESTWGWDYPALAMTAARLERPQDAVRALLLPTVKNRVDAAGHFVQTSQLPAYLPGNGGTLVAVALMAAGWDGGPPDPGLPTRWSVRHEGLLPLPA